MAHLESDRRGSAAEFASAVLKRPLPMAWPSKRAWGATLVAMVILLAWEAAARGQLIAVLYFSMPSQILSAGARMFSSGVLIEHLAPSLGRMGFGMLVGGVPGLLLGLGMGASRRLRLIVDPLIAAVHPIPKIAVLPLIMVIFGVGEPSKVIVAAMGAFFPLVINAMAGVSQINAIHFDVARNCGAQPWQIFLRVIWPGSKPLVLAGLRLALNTTLLLTVAVEMVSANRGLGAMIWMAWTTLRVEEIYLSLSFITLIGLLINMALHFLSRWLIPWQVDRTT